MLGCQLPFSSCFFFLFSSVFSFLSSYFLLSVSSGHIPTPPLNFAALAFESPFDRDTVESCVREIVGSVSRAVAARRNVELSFSGIGRLQIRDSRVKMRFYKEFITQMDGGGEILESMQNVSLVHGCCYVGDQNNTLGLFTVLASICGKSKRLYFFWLWVFGKKSKQQINTQIFLNADYTAQKDDQ